MVAMKPKDPTALWERGDYRDWSSTVSDLTME